MANTENTRTGNPIIVLAGATGELGSRIAGELLKRGAHIRALVRPGSVVTKHKALQQNGVSLIEVDFTDMSALTKACAGGSCVISALSGLREVIVEAQTLLLQAAVAAGVTRFIPSDFAVDFTKLPYGTNRNLDLRKEFHERVNKAPIKATSILCGMFTDLLTGQAPVVLSPIRRVVYWENADQLLDFTTMSDTAVFTAAAALDASTPRYLRIAGDVISARGLTVAASQASAKQFRLLRAGDLGRLDALIKFTRTIFPQKQEVFPAWQGMQYMRNMFSGIVKLKPLDNTRYPDIRWTPVQQVLAAHIYQQKQA